MICKSCGKQLSDGAKFCNGCGASLTDAEAAPQEKRRIKPFVIVLIIMGAVLTTTAMLVIILAVCLYLYNKPTEIHPMEPETTQAYVDDGNPLSADNPYRAYFDPHSSYILPDSSDRYYTYAELQHYSLEQLNLAFHEIYMRHGQRPSDVYLQEYFDNMPWYKPSDEELLLSFQESANAKLLSLIICQREGDDGTSFNPYFACSNADYFLLDSNSRYLTADDLEKLSLDALVLARSEILARHGVVFSDAFLHTYFYMRDWYVPSVHESEFSTEALNDFELANLQLIEVYEKINKGGYAPASDNPYMPYYDPATQLLLPKSNNTKLTAQDLAGLNPDQLIIVRNEIIARHGYTFSDRELMEYFLQCSWYRPSTAPGRTDLVKGMTSLEYENMDLIYQYEQNPQSVSGNAGSDLSALDTSLTYVCENEIYSVTMPAYWKDHAVVEKWNNEAGIPQMSFYEAPDHNKNGIGHLFTLKLQPLEDFYDYPQYSELGIISNGTNTYRFIILYPSDVQFNDENRELYSQMSGDSTVRKTLKLKNGYEFVD